MGKMEKYESAGAIPADVIRDRFAAADTIIFSARRFNRLDYRKIAFGDLGWWLPVTHVLPIIGVTPTMLRPVFNPQRWRTRRRFPFNLSWFGFNKNRYRDVDVELPKTIESYEALGSFPLSKDSFLKLSKVLEKPIAVFREDGGSGEHDPLFTAYPSGQIGPARTGHV